MDEKQFMQDLWDLMQENTDYITPDQFREKYGSLLLEVDCEAGHIRMTDDHNEWHLCIQKVWCDETQVK